ncbi:putative DNA binding domain-containing protein [Adlercreutzia equolifaciens]|jgi:ATP-dependent DNA helicase RecG|uniref:ATP-binding protein n=1 Tax=Adlercreutzia rubneri TaxID=2916441 RepID=UPI001D097630|nr:ATP-binding protein [Adlercreutzia rubneri]MCB6759462.1 putative DNA binding domain-containing protein [Adlercreutzia equolifaciens]MCB6975192.1 putative DNA binding domain-containing protein [Adlercreutzia equolifaciens]MDE8683607.1 ATP-binding protein [Adlercreutzia rubneri]
MRETATLEFKQQLSKSYLKTVSAYANYGTGKIIFGIADDGTPVGLADPQDTCLRIEHAINDSIDPVPRFELAIEEDARTVTLTVHEGPDKPYLSSGRAYRRTDTSTVEVSRLEHSRLVLTGEHVSFDALVAKEQDLAFGHLEKELASKLGLKPLDQNSLISLELMTPSGEYCNAAALLADSNHFPGIDIARFGESINIINARHTFEHMSVLEQMQRTLEVFDTYYAYEEIVGFERIAKTLVPREAFREAIANALVHRCWDVRANIKVGMFADRIEITSPGGLPAGITEELYLAGGPSVARNPILANVFFRLGHIERFGTGIPRILDEYAHETVSPSFALRDSSITVMLPVTVLENVTLDEEAILAVLAKGSALTRSQISEKTQLSKSKAIRTLNALVEKGLVTKVGEGRSVRYERN